MVSKNVLIIVFAAVVLTACGKSGDGSKASPPASAAPIATKESSVYEFKREALLSLDKYAKVNRSRGYWLSNDEAIERENSLYRGAFWSGAKADYDLLAYDFLPEYRKEKDTFKRLDIVKANQDRLDAAYKEAQKNKHYALYFDNENTVTVGRYDPVKKGFEVGFGIDEYNAYLWNKPNEGKGEREQWGFQIFGAAFTANDNRVWFIPKNEDEARKIEEALSAHRGGNDRAFFPASYLGHVVASDTKPGPFNPYSALMVLDGVAIHQPKSGEVIFTVALEPTHKSFEVFDSKVKSQIDRVVGQK